MAGVRPGTSALRQDGPAHGGDRCSRTTRLLNARPESRWQERFAPLTKTPAHANIYKPASLRSDLAFDSSETGVRNSPKPPFETAEIRIEMRCKHIVRPG